MRTLLGLFIAVFLMGCNTFPFQKFDHVKTGMDKAEVVEIIGNPTKSRRWQGKDRWIYEFQDRATGVTNYREVHFEGGRVVYSGGRVDTKTTAAEQDRINESIAADDKREADEERELREKALGVARVKRFKDQKLDADDRRLRESMYGLPADPEYERRKVAPIFTPVK